jgi:hypothetical protein
MTKNRKKVCLVSGLLLLLQKNLMVMLMHMIKSIDLNNDLLLKKLDMARIECSP